MNRTGATSITGLVVAAILYVAANTLFDVSAPQARIDLTEDTLFTLSTGTHATLAKIDEPIDLHFFYSERLAREVPAYAAFGRRVEDLLVEIANASRGKVILHQHNPQPFSSQEDHAVSYGVQGIPVDESSELAYFGLAGVSSVDKVELIPFFQPERESLLEYDLAQIIHALSNPEPPVLGLMSSLPIFGDMQAQLQGRPTTPWAIAHTLNTNFKVINLPQSIDDLPANIQVMMVVHPRPLSARMQYELEQFLFRGGRMVLLVDPRAESDRSVGPNDISTSTASLPLLFAQWGIEVPSDQITGDRSMASRVNAGTAQRPIPADYLAWLSVTPDFMRQGDPVTSSLPEINIASAGFILRKDDAPLRLEPLIFSSTNSAPIDVNDVRGVRPDIVGILKNFKADARSYVMAARLSGELQTAFPDGPPERLIKKSAADLQQKPDRAQLMKSNDPVNLIVVADSDFIEDRFWIRTQNFYGREVPRPFASNADFVVNAISNLAGSDELIRLRSRGVAQRPFKRVNELKQKAELRLRDNERELQQKLKQAQARVAQLQGVKTNTDSATGEIKVEVSLTAEQRNEVEALRQEMISSRTQLRDVQRGLREEVEALEAWLQFLNIGLMPLIVTVGAVVVCALGAVRRRRSYAGD